MFMLCYIHILTVSHNVNPCQSINDIYIREIKCTKNLNNVLKQNVTASIVDRRHSIYAYCIYVAV